MAADGVTQPRWLLLVPQLPTGNILSAWKTTYGPNLTSCLKDASKVSKIQSTVILDVALAQDAQQNFDYRKLQTTIGMAYRLVCAICSDQKIDVQYDNDVDVRVCLFQHVKSEQQFIINLSDLALSGRIWTHVYTFGDEVGDSLLQDFLRIRRNLSPLAHDLITHRLPGRPMMNQPIQKAAIERSSSCNSSRHPSVAVGGTFDHLHVGHKLLLTMTALVLKPPGSDGAADEGCLTVGITGDALLKNKKYIEQLEDWNHRQSSVESFMLDTLQLISPGYSLDRSEKSSGQSSDGIIGSQVCDYLCPRLQIKFVEISDPCGPTITDENITALVLSAETRSGGGSINDKRKEKAWSSLEIFEVDVLDSGDIEDGGHDQENESFQGKLSSTEIRSRIWNKQHTTC